MKQLTFFYFLPFFPLCFPCLFFFPLSVSPNVRHVVERRGFAVERFVDQRFNVLGSFFVRLFQRQGSSQILNVFLFSQFGDACGKHHVEQIDQQICVLSQHIIRSLASTHVLVPSVGIQISNHSLILMGEDERSSLALDAKLGLVVPQKMSKVNVKQVAQHRDHDVVIVTIADSQHVTFLKKKKKKKKKSATHEANEQNILTLRHNTPRSTWQNCPGILSFAPRSASFET
jgi:hypothetical protein